MIDDVDAIALSELSSVLSAVAASLMAAPCHAMRACAGAYREATWRALEDQVALGHIRHIGVRRHAERRRSLKSFLSIASKTPRANGRPCSLLVPVSKGQCNDTLVRVL